MSRVTAWLSIEAIAVTAPILLAFRYGTGEPETLWSNLAIITGSQAAATLVVAVLFASRYKAITHTIGIDSAINIHRILGSGAVLFMLAHLIAVVADYPPNAWIVDIFQAPARSLAGTSALIILLLSVYFGNSTKEYYEKWRWAHRIAALVAVAFIFWHVIGLNQLINDVPWLLFFTILALATISLIISRIMRARNHSRLLVKTIASESPTASTMYLRPIGKEFKFSPGQFAWLRLNKKAWAEDHPFTIASSAHDPTVRITFRHVGDWTTGPLPAIRPGKIIRLDGPHGAMSLKRIPQDRNLALVARGVGLTPVMSILRTLAEEEDTRQIAVFIAPDEDLFRPELDDLEVALPGMVLYPQVVRPITRRTFAVIENPQEWFYLVCGPPRMVVDCKLALTRLSVPESQILTEQFEII